MLKKVFSLKLALLVLLIFPAVAFGSYAYDYARDDFNYGADCLASANDCWRTLGFSYSSYYGSNFTESTFLANCDLGDAVYVDTHGSTTSIWDDANNDIYTSEVNTARNTDWKRLIFLDACHTAETPDWANAWGISDGDGSEHCFIGWDGYSYDNYDYYKFVDTFYLWVGYQDTIYDAIYQAWLASNVDNWNYYGNVNWSY